ncbi:hypothetical protein K8I61_01985, partial [bacterium]|nr:hypothetical protein [bacterium]
MTQCKATTKSGRPCRATAVTGKDYCHTHLRLMGEEPPERDGTFASAITGNDEAPVPAPAIPAAPADDGRDPGGVSEPEPAAETAGEPERPADRPSPPIASPPIPPVSRSWSSNASKEEISMDDKKNVSFVSGLALILSALALLLIGISQISSSPYDATMEEIVNQRLEDLESRVDVKLEAGLRKIQRAEENAAVRELRTFQSQLDAWMQSIATEGQTQRIESIRQQIQGLISELEKGMPDAPPAAAMPLPVPPPPATTAA